MDLRQIGQQLAQALIGDGVEMDFAVTKSDKSNGDKKSCKKGLPCGGSCIAADKKCKSELPKKTDTLVAAVKKVRPKAGEKANPAPDPSRNLELEEIDGIMNNFRNGVWSEKKAQEELKKSEEKWKKIWEAGLYSPPPSGFKRKVQNPAQAEIDGALADFSKKPVTLKSLSKLRKELTILADRFIRESPPVDAEASGTTYKVAGKFAYRTKLGNNIRSGHEISYVKSIRENEWMLPKSAPFRVEIDSVKTFDARTGLPGSDNYIEFFPKNSTIGTKILAIADRYAPIKDADDIRDKRERDIQATKGLREPDVDDWDGAAKRLDMIIIAEVMNAGNDEKDVERVKDLLAVRRYSRG